MKYGVQRVSIRSLIRKGWLDTEMRVKVNDAKVTQCAEEKREGANFPPPVVFADPDTQLFWVGDGFHRILADKENGAKVVEVELRRGKVIDAVLHCIYKNKLQRGLPFTTGDKSKAAETLLRSPDTADWPLSRIAETVGCNHSTVSWIKNKLGIERPETVTDRNGRRKNTGNIGRNSGIDDVDIRRKIVRKLLLSGTPQVQIADDLGVSVSTVDRDRRAIESEGDLVTCPHCNGTGKVSNLRGKR